MLKSLASSFPASGAIARARLSSTLTAAPNSAPLSCETPLSPVLKRGILFDGRVARLTMVNAKKRNPLSYSLMDQLCRELKTLSDMKTMRAVILAGEGPAFSAGHDFSELVSTGHATGTAQHQRDVFGKCTELMQQIQQMELPVIVEVDGVAAAAGCQLVAQCDIAIASERAQFSVPGLRAGLFCSTPAIPLVRNVPRKVAMDMLLTARSLTAKEALEVGLVSRIAVAPNTLESETTKVVEEILKMSRSVIALGKAFFYTQVEHDINQAYRLGETVMRGNLQLDDGKEGIRAFLEKRPPKWKEDDTRGSE